jgi:CubicO group peptidase (beta-lactamase class C family)
MKKILILFALMAKLGKSQSLYFPPITGNTWDTISLQTLGWCPDKVDSLISYVGRTNAKAFIILKNGKIALEKYYGTFTVDSVHAWNSAGKSLTSMLTGIAQQKGLFTINDTVSTILGNGWTSCTNAQERQITIRNLITMTSGLNDAPTGTCTNPDATPACLQYLTAPYTRWAYHTGAYRKMEDVIATAAGVTYTNFTNTSIGSAIGMNGLWVNYVFYSKTRDAARFGLLALNKGVWNNDTILHDTAYFHAMTNTSQSFNLSYGYLWWLNGKSSYMSPGTQIVFNQMLIPNAPPDMFAALGKNDQKIYVVPSQNMVVVRMGNSSYGVAEALSPFDNELWGYIDSLTCIQLGIAQVKKNTIPLIVYPNPANDKITISGNNAFGNISIYNTLGEVVLQVTSKNNEEEIDISKLSSGFYFVRALNSIQKISKQ